MADVFISYSEGDASPLVRKIADALDRAGISCWYMEKDSQYGSYAGAITRAIRECRVFLVVLNERSKHSKDVLSEVGIAFKSDKAIVPFNLDNCAFSDDLFYHLHLYTIVSANSSEEKSVHDLVRRIAKILNREPKSAQPITLTPQLVQTQADPLSAPPKKGKDAVADVFISYHRSDSAWALVCRIVHELEHMGISCWYDTKDPKLGYFVKAIADEIEQCKVFLLLWDEGANKSRYCISETHYAFSYAKNTLIIPFQVGAFELDDRLSLYTGPFQIIFGGESPETANTDELIRKIVSELSPLSEKIIKLGKCGDKVTYELNKNGVLMISGKGSMRDFEWNKETQTCNMPWWDEREMISHVCILNGVSSIGGFAFLYCKGLASVDIPDSVTSTGPWTFTGCEKLESVSVPAEMEIKNGAFPFYTEIIRRPPKE